MAETKTTKPKVSHTKAQEDVKIESKTSNKLLAAVLIRGMINMRQDIRDTLKMLHLQRTMYCTVMPDTLVHRNMMRKCKDYLTYGEINEETHKELVAKRGKGKKYFALHPPRGGFERKGIKKSYTQKGALGYRGEKINDLIKRML